jgi:FSR family fosmidomycin resistance protein-like MFS transporter
MLDVFTGFLAVYLVDVAGAPAALAAAAVGLRLGAGLFGGLLVIPMVERLPGALYLRVSALLQLALYPAFLLVPSLPAKLAILLLLSLSTAGWYPVLMAGVYSAMPGRSGTVMTMTDLFNLAGGLIPAAIGLIASGAGLSLAMWLLLLSPLAILLAVGPFWSGGGATSER